MCGRLSSVRAAFMIGKYDEVVISNGNVSIIQNASGPKSRQESRQARTRQCFGHDPALIKRSRRACHVDNRFLSSP